MTARRDYEDRLARVEDHENRLREAERQYGAAQTADSSDALDADELRGFVTEWDTLTSDDRRTLLSAVIEKAILGPPGKGPRLTVIPTAGGRVSLKKLPRESGGLPLTAQTLAEEHQLELKRLARRRRKT